MTLFKEVDGTCPYCGSKTINVIEGMVFNYMADNGVPNVLLEERYRLGGFCTNCSHQLYPIPNGEGGYIFYPNYMKNIFDNIGGLGRTVIGGKILDSVSTEVNPFTNVREFNASMQQEEQPDEDGLISDDVPW